MIDNVSRKNAENTFEELFRLGVIPIVSENDTVSLWDPIRWQWHLICHCCIPDRCRSVSFFCQTSTDCLPMTRIQTRMRNWSRRWKNWMKNTRIWQKIPPEAMSVPEEWQQSWMQQKLPPIPVRIWSLPMRKMSVSCIKYLKTTL